MNSREFVLETMRLRGAADARGLRAAAGSMDDTAIIAEEVKIPAFDGSKDYTSWPAGAPVTYNGQVYKLLQPYNAGNYPDSNPGNTPALWGVAHTKDAVRAKPWIAPLGTSGNYSKDECCTSGGKTYRSIMDNNAWSPSEYPAGWDEVTSNG